MATNPELGNLSQEDDELLLDDPIGDDDAISDDDAPTAEAEEAGEEETVIEIEGGDEEEVETPIIKRLRTEIRDRDRQLAEFRKAPQPQRVELGPKPTLEACEYDEDRFERELDAWKDREHRVERQTEEQERERRATEEAHGRVVSNYRAKAAALGVKDFDEAEQAVVSTLPVLLQNVLLNYAENPAMAAYVLGKHPSKLEALAAEADPIKFAIALRDIERNVKVIKRQKPPAPEAQTIQRSSTSVAQTSGDKKLEALRKKARESGDRTELLRYERDMAARKR